MNAIKSAIVVLMFCLPALAEDSSRLKAAEDRCAASIKAAETVFLRAQLAALNVLSRDLQAALDDALKAKKLDEANAIANRQKDVKAEIEKINDKLSARTVLQLPATSDWTTAKKVRKGELIKIEAKGSWTWSGSHEPQFFSDGNGTNNKRRGLPIETANMGALIYRIGNGPPAVAGNSISFRAEEDGELQLRINDGELSDNAGELTITVSGQ